MGYIKYKEKKYKTVTINLSRKSEFNALLKEFHKLFFTDVGHKIEHIRYAVLELVNNSMRAHKERRTDKPIQVRFKMAEDFLEIRIKDAGGGFDTEALPYDIEADVNLIDLNSPSFQSYRERHGYNRFGMGLLITKKTFDDFSINFYGPRGESPRWEKDETEGTVIRMRSLIET